MKTYVFVLGNNNNHRFYGLRRGCKLTTQQIHTLVDECALIMSGCDVVVNNNYSPRYDEATMRLRDAILMSFCLDIDFPDAWKLKTPKHNLLSVLIL